MKKPIAKSISRSGTFVTSKTHLRACPTKNKSAIMIIAVAIRPNQEASIKSYFEQLLFSNK